MKLRHALFCCALAVPMLPAFGQDAKPALETVAELRTEARSFEHGEGVKKDPARAIALYCKAARQGDAEAQFSLGWIHANGRGTPRDDELAAYFFTLAAQQGHQQAAGMLRFVGTPRPTLPDCMRDTEAEALQKARQAALESASPERRKVIELLFKLAPNYGIDPDLGLAVIKTESNFNPAAVSPKNAQGLMQLIPETAARFQVTKPFDPEQNIRGGLAYLRWLLSYFKGNVALVAAAYNAGEGAVDRYKGVPPYAETQEYVKRIVGSFKKAEHPYDASIAKPSPDLDAMRLRARM